MKRRTARTRRGRTLRGRLTALFVLASSVLVVGSGFLIAALQSRSAEAALDSSLKTRIDRIVATLKQTAGKLPLTESYAQVVTSMGTVKDLSPAIGKDELLLTPGQLRFVINEGRLRVDKEIPALGGRSTLLAELRKGFDGPIIVIVGAPRDQASEATRRLLTTLAFSGVGLVALLGLGGWLLAGAALRPVGRMADRAAAISAANLGQRVLGPSDTPVNATGEPRKRPRWWSRRRTRTKAMPAELAHLGSTLDDMLGRLDDSFRRERAFVDDASHELRTPLAIVRGELELALLHPGNVEETTATIESSLQQVTRLGALADDLLVLARAGVNNTARPVIDAGAVVESLTARLRPQVRNGVRLEFAEPDERGGPPAMIRPGDLERIVTNLVTNATRAARSLVRISLSSDGSTTKVVVADDGPGFAPDIVDRAFERFAVGSSSRTGSGTGLGLSIVAALVEAAEGSVVATNRGELCGATVTVTLRTGPSSHALD